jgi:UDP-3-O-[3-hydroxymyristoyl] glucosamine N-acyltransferase
MIIEYALHELAQHVGGEVFGNKAVIINRLSALGDAQEGALSFLANANYRALLQTTKASALIVREEDVDQCLCPVIVVLDPYLAYAKISHLFDKRAITRTIHSTAVIDASAKLGINISIAAHVTIGANVVIADGVVVGAGTAIGDRCNIGEETQIASNVSVYSDVVIGKRNIIHSGAVIGADGFGFANEKGAWIKIAQLGGVQLGDDVEIGACVTIDRGALNDTIIEDGVKLDNQIQVAHNVKIGKHTAIAGCTGIAGSTTIGAYCTIAGGVGIVGHITIADNVHITGMTLVTKSILEPGVYSSGMAAIPDAQWKKSVARFRQLDDMAKKLNRLEKLNNDK